MRYKLIPALRAKIEPARNPWSSWLKVAGVALRNKKGPGLNYLQKQERCHSMNYADIDQIRSELQSAYADCHVKVADDQREMVAEISDGFAVAVIERSQPHFHLRMTEVYRVLRGMLYLACSREGHVLRVGESITIRPGQIHHARCGGEPTWIEVESSPPRSSDDHIVL